MARNFICPATGEQCSDPGCKIGYCIAEIEEREWKIAALRVGDAKLQEVIDAAFEKYGVDKAYTLILRALKDGITR